MPKEKIPYDYFLLPTIDAYYKAGAKEKGSEVLGQLLDTKEGDLKYFFGFKGKKANSVANDRNRARAVTREIEKVARQNGDKEVEERAKSLFEDYYQQAYMQP